MVPNSEEVDDVKYVTFAELQRMMRPDSGLLWSPWFRVIVEKFVGKWWADLNKTLTTDAHVDVKTIHRFDPILEHIGCYNESRVGKKDVQKQGSYGKVRQ